MSQATGRRCAGRHRPKPSEWASSTAGRLLLLIPTLVDAWVVVTPPNEIYRRPTIPRPNGDGRIHGQQQLQQHHTHLHYTRPLQQEQHDDVVAESTTPQDDDDDDDDDLARSYRLIAESDPDWFSEFVVSTLRPVEHTKRSTNIDKDDDDDEEEKCSTTLVSPRLQALIQQFENGEIKPSPREEMKSKREEVSVVEEKRTEPKMSSLDVGAPIEPPSKLETLSEMVKTVNDSPKPNQEPIVMAKKSKESDDTSSSMPPMETMASAEPLETENGQKVKASLPTPKERNRLQQSQKQTEKPSRDSSKPPPSVFDDMYEGILSVFGQGSATVSSSKSGTVKGDKKRDKNTAKDSLMEDKPSSPILNIPKSSKDSVVVENTRADKPVEVKVSSPISTSTNTKPATDSKPVDQVAEKVNVEAKEERVVIFRSRQSKPYKQAPLSKLRDLGFTKDDEITLLDPEALGLILSDSVHRPRKGVPSYWENQGGRGLGQVRIVEAMEAKEILSRDGGGTRPLSPPSSQRSPASTINPKVEGTESKEKSQSQNPGQNFEATVSVPKAGESRKDDDTAWDPIRRGPEGPRKRRDVNSGPELSIPEQPTPQESGSKINRIETQNDSQDPVTPPPPPPEGNRRFVVYRSENTKSRFKKVSLDRLEAMGYEEKDLKTLLPDALEFVVAENVPKPKRGIPANWKVEQGPGTADDDEEKGVRIMEAAEAVTFLTNIPNPQERRKRRRPQDTAEEVRERDRSAEAVSRRRRDRPDSIDDVSDTREKRQRSSHRDDGQPKPMYSGRQPSFTESKVTRRPDPPKPTGFWPDIDTFRSLLREEAKMRVSLVGDGMAGMVKNECDWRLELYKDWLWTLHDGVGNPIVESRSDRARRMGDLPPPPPRSSDKPRRRTKPKPRQRTREE